MKLANAETISTAKSPMCERVYVELIAIWQGWAQLEHHSINSVPECQFSIMEVKELPLRAIWAAGEVVEPGD